MLGKSLVLECYNCLLSYNAIPLIILGPSLCVKIVGIKDQILDKYAYLF